MGVSTCHLICSVLAYLFSSVSSYSAASDNTVILNFSMCDPEEATTPEGSQRTRPWHINDEAKAVRGHCCLV